MAKSALTTEQILTILAAGPQQIADSMAALTPAQLRAAPQPGAWSATELLGHLRSCADVWGDCMATILTQDHPTLRAINPTTWVNQTDYPAQQFEPSLQAFATQRAELLTLLQPLTPAQWARTATVTGAGRPLERTLFFYAHWLASHERTHFKQFKRIAAILHG